MDDCIQGMKALKSYYCQGSTYPDLILSSCVTVIKLETHDGFVNNDSDASAGLERKGYPFAEERLTLHTPGQSDSSDVSADYACKVGGVCTLDISRTIAVYFSSFQPNLAAARIFRFQSDG